MKLVKIILIVVEVTALVAVALLAFNYNELEVDTLIKGLYIVLFSLLAVVMQKEQQSIDWYEEDEEPIKVEDDDWQELDKWEEEKFQDQLEQYIEGWG
jgi:hypothetical protein